MIDLDAMDEREFIAFVGRRPGMFTGRVTYDAVTSFLTGYARGAARNGGHGLDGLREWLLQRLGHGSPLGWPGIVLQLTFPDAEQLPTEFTPAQQETALRTLFDLLDAFLAERAATPD
ncbi:hypothetical protein LX16_2593 [Stackebrandtia albiflava]|uniref:Uncharacterized protein n=1 Tax=Stackebrandtia albiflava TaxID=406432 RepID=A0A562V1R8_9ACTN|nr:hypothetical protein [Stackebrandtia albiflava]TWJ11856.1 hypothetical protein LX16_2593 [Stackebrandtia albiflava]